MKQTPEADEPETVEELVAAIVENTEDIIEAIYETLASESKGN